MREDTEQEKKLKSEIERLEKLIAIHERQTRYESRVIHVLVAVGAVNGTLVEKAREIVSSFD